MYSKYSPTLSTEYMTSEKRVLLDKGNEPSTGSSSGSSMHSSGLMKLEWGKALGNNDGGKYGSVTTTQPVNAVNIPLLETLLHEAAPRGPKPPALVVGSAPVFSINVSEDEAENVVEHRRPSRAYSHQNLLFVPELLNQTDQLLSNIESYVARARIDIRVATADHVTVDSTSPEIQSPSHRFDAVRNVTETLLVQQRIVEETFARLADIAVRYDRLSETGDATKALRSKERRKSVVEKTIHDLLMDANAELDDYEGGNLLTNESKIVVSARRYPVRAGQVLPIILLLVLWSVLIALTWHTYLGHYDWLVLLRVVRSPLLIVSYSYLIAINMKVWAVARIDYVTIFRFHSSTAPTPKYAFRAASGFMAVFSGIVAGYLLLSAWVYNTEGMLVAVGVIMWALLVMFSLNPVDIFCRSGRYALIKSLGRTILAPLFKVQFGDGWLGDQLVSLVIVFLDLEYFFCYCICASKSGPVTALDASVCTSNVHFIRPIITVLPTTWRFFQCLRGYIDTKNSLHLWNAGKYFTTYPVVVFATAYQPQHFSLYSVFNNFTFDNSSWVVFFWLLSSLLNATYCFIWDVVFDWKLVQFAERKHVCYQSLKCWTPHYRRSCLFMQPWYLLAIAIDLIFRFLWTLKISLAVAWRVNSDLIFTALNFAEFFRRFVWNFLRVELQWIEIRPKG